MKTILLFFPSRSYTSRIYACKDGILYDSGSGVYSGKGIRIFINARYRPMKEKNIWARYTVSVYQQIRIIGSGPDEIAGNKKAELKLQLR